MRSVTIILPLPNAKLHAHAKGHWRSKATATKTARATAKLEAMAATRKSFLKATISYAWFLPDRRRRDETNLIQSAKPYVDGLVDARVLAGDHWQVLKLVTGSVQVDKDNPRVEITIADWE